MSFRSQGGCSAGNGSMREGSPDGRDSLCVELVKGLAFGVDNAMCRHSWAGREDNLPCINFGGNMPEDIVMSCKLPVMM